MEMKQINNKDVAISRSPQKECLYDILKHYCWFLGYHCNIAVQIQKFTDSYILL